VTEMGPYKVPEGIVVWPMIYALQNSLHNWDDPEDFNPVSTQGAAAVAGAAWGHHAPLRAASAVRTNDGRLRRTAACDTQKAA
jgi:hypothetical protein